MGKTSGDELDYFTAYPHRACIGRNEIVSLECRELAECAEGCWGRIHDPRCVSFEHQGGASCTGDGTNGCNERWLRDSKAHGCCQMSSTCTVDESESVGYNMWLFVRKSVEQLNAEGRFG